MARAGISGIGIKSALGGNRTETLKNLFADFPALPGGTDRYQTELDLPVFTLPEKKDPEFFFEWPVYLLQHALEEALSHANLTLDDLKNKRVGVAVGTTVACQLNSLCAYTKLRNGDTADAKPFLRYVLGMPAEYVRRTLNLNGPAVTISNACASGADAVMLGLNWLKNEECDLVIAAGCDSVEKVSLNGFNALRVCSAEPCRPFDAKRSGLNLGDGAGVVILEDPAQAEKRGIKVEFEVAGAGKTADGFHITQPEGSGTELERAIRLALKESALVPEDIDFINAHGTGTLVNDRVEGSVLPRIFGNGLLYHSTKAMTGHTLGAAGTLELILTMLMLKEKKICASHRFETLPEELTVPPVQEVTPVAGNAAVSTSLAFGGSNTALVVKRIDFDKKEKSAAEDQDLFIAAACVQENGAPDKDTVLAVCRKYAMRRIDRLTQLAVVTADKLAEHLDPREETALITVTSYGPMATSCKVLDDILDFPENQILPTGFSHSVVNAAASYIGAALKLHGPTFAIAGFEDPFREGVKLAKSLLTGGRCSKVMLVALDEENIIRDAAEPLRKSGIPLRAEGSCGLLLTLDPAQNRCGKLELTDDTAAERLLPCGIPADLLPQLERADRTDTVRLNKLHPSHWN